ncbi:universal stress protein [Bradyrhizobium sp. GCM10027634]|uniref:universal stress protein n=1 Tax=unclassified Bradyrhizobium TaxID=2631580 RepID=UPI00263B6D4B|nr:universal stress protein [Bradyrhizobium sp. WYCCWR 12677]MDN5001320.1 universal stress protein [Bradyrhizobium sp. WYCCWR 12677]
MRRSTASNSTNTSPAPVGDASAFAGCDLREDRLEAAAAPFAYRINREMPDRLISVKRLADRKAIKTDRTFFRGIIMSVASVMVYVDSEQQEAGQVAVAGGIAKTFGAAVLGISAVAVEPPFVAEGVIIEQTTEEDLKRIKAMLSAKEAWFKRVTGLPSETVEWRWALQYPTDFLVEQARAADLVIVKRRTHTASHYRFFDPAGAMLRMGRPTLSVPERVTKLSGDRIVVGWKDTREARLAVRDAMPFLTRASQVTIAEICTSDEQDAARKRVRDVAGYLQRHGVQCQNEIRVHTAEPDGGYLIRLASELDADLIVAGGYGHSRLGEWIFGGMTETLLQQAPVCLLMSH